MGETSFNVVIDDIEFDLDIIIVNCSLSNADLLLGQPALERPGVVLTVTDGKAKLTKLTDPTVEIQLQSGDMAFRTKFSLIAMKDCYLLPRYLSE